MFFFLKVMFNRIPWFDETLTDAQIALVPNTMSSDSLWIKEDDFRQRSPPANSSDSWKSQSACSKHHRHSLSCVYTDNKYTVTGTDAAKLNQVVSLTNDVINSGMYSLQPDFAYNFSMVMTMDPSQYMLYNTLSMTEHKSEAD
jgi:hypothetical protein